MNREDFKRCIEATLACAAACDAASSGGLKESNTHAMEDCVELSKDCAEICRLAVSYMERDSKQVAAMLLACVKACEHCQRECDKYMMNYCAACSAACRKCVVECQAVLAKLNEQEHHHSRDSVIAGMRE
jgi:hypothetical protein